MERKHERFYVPSITTLGEIWVNGDEAHHMLHVKRVRPGERVCLFDGAGKEAIGKVVEALRDRARIEIEELEVVDREARIDITLAFSIPKGKRSELLVQKCSELGVKRLIPLECQRSVVKLRPGSGEKVEKWKRVALEASKQCGRTYITEILEVLPFSKLLDTAGSYDLSILASTGPGVSTLKKTIRDKTEVRSILCIVGPEGGFTQEEEERAKLAGCKRVSLGPSILRIETAAMALVSMLLYAYSCSADL